jgi:hypothetical protein
MIYKSYSLQFDAILDYHIKNELRSIDEVIKMNVATRKAVRLVQSEVETKIEKNSIKDTNGGKKRVIDLESMSTANLDASRNKISKLKF